MPTKPHDSLLFFSPILNRTIVHPYKHRRMKSPKDTDFYPVALLNRFYILNHGGEIPFACIVKDADENVRTTRRSPRTYPVVLLRTLHSPCPAHVAQRWPRKALQPMPTLILPRRMILTQEEWRSGDLMAIRQERHSAYARKGIRGFVQASLLYKSKEVRQKLEEERERRRDYGLDESMDMRLIHRFAKMKKFERGRKRGSLLKYEVCQEI